jgi:hypothetical protein
MININKFLCYVFGHKLIDTYDFKRENRLRKLFNIIYKKKICLRCKNEY